MEDLRLADRARRRLVQVLEDDRPEPDRWLSRLRSWSEEEAQPALSHAVRLLFHLDLPEDEAAVVIAKVLEHRRAMSLALGRDPGLRIAGVDFLSNVDARLTSPRIVEMEEFERTERRARTDALTGLFNRRHFRGAIDHEVRRARRYRSPLALLLLDADHFKDVNDGHGHLLGDQVLARLGAVVRRSVRDADVACRFGGEEIAILLPETRRWGAHAVGERIRRSVEDAFAGADVAGVRVAITVSGGIACLPQDAATSTALVERADRALFLAKDAGRNRVVAYHDEKRADVRLPGRADVRVRLRGAGGAAAPAWIVDVSRTGALVEAERLPAPSAFVELDVEEAGPEGRLRGRIVRVEGPSHAAPRRRAGIAFECPIAEGFLRDRLAVVGAPPRPERGARR